MLGSPQSIFLLSRILALCVLVALITLMIFNSYLFDIVLNPPFIVVVNGRVILLQSAPS